jgi:hypothetical protein
MEPPRNPGRFKAALDGRGPKPQLPVRKADNFAVIKRPALVLEELQHVLGGHHRRLLADDVEEDPQV